MKDPYPPQHQGLGKEKPVSIESKDMAAEALELLARTVELEKRATELEDLLSSIGKAEILYVQPNDVVVISGIDWDASLITDEQNDIMKRMFGVAEVMFLSGPADFHILRHGEEPWTCGDCGRKGITDAWCPDCKEIAS